MKKTEYTHLRLAPQSRITVLKSDGVKKKSTLLSKKSDVGIILKKKKTAIVHNKGKKRTIYSNKLKRDKLIKKNFKVSRNMKLSPRKKFVKIKLTAKLKNKLKSGALFKKVSKKIGQKLRSIRIGKLFRKKFKLAPKGKFSLLKKIGGINPASTLKNKLLSQRASTQQGETGVESTKLGLQFIDYSRRGIKTSAKGVKKSVKVVRKLSKKITKKIMSRKPRQIQKAVKRTLKTVKSIVRGTMKAVRNVAKIVKNVVKIVKAIIKVIIKAVKLAVKATAKMIQLLCAFPFNLIIIGVILLIIIVSMIVSSTASSAGGTVTGGIGWATDDNDVDIENLTQEVYENYKKYLEEAKDVLEKKIKEVLSDKVESFCEPVPPNTPKHILEYNGTVYYPAPSGKAAVLKKIEDFEIEDYVDFFSVLFVMLTREKQAAEGVDDTQIYDFDFIRTDFEEFMGDINDNVETYLYKTSVITGGNPCPGQDCKRKTRPHCYCCYYYDEDGNKIKYCGGHPYCPYDHDKLTINLYEMSDFMSQEIMDILNFSENERTKAELSKEILERIIEEMEASEEATEEGG